jgi:integrase
MLGAYSGLRFGERFGLRWRNLDLLRRRADEVAHLTGPKPTFSTNGTRRRLDRVVSSKVLVILSAVQP